MAPTYYCGLYIIPTVATTCYYTPQHIVPLKNVEAQATLVDSVAEVTLTQQYVNLESRTIEAEYIFPLDARSAVCKFEATVDGRTITGIVQEKQEARQTYNRAVARGDGAYLLEQEKTDIFKTKIGNLLPGQEVMIHITYVATMKNEMESLRFVLPTNVAPRYNPASSYSWFSGSGWWNSSHGSSCVQSKSWVPYKLGVNVNIHMLSAIENITSTSHGINSVVSGSSATVSTVFDQIAMDGDFVVNIKCQDPHQPRCVVEDNNGSKALMVTLMPKFKLQDQPVEAIFIVDRSGSMGGVQIKEAQNAMQLFLRSLPENSYFNIVGFGSNYETLFRTSMKYTDNTLHQATIAIPSMDANLGGTEILAPLNYVFSQPTLPGFARQVFILTDGQVSNTEQVCEEVRRNNRSSRTFALGIGHSVSHELVEGIAAAGGGTAAFVIPGEALEAKVMQQLKHAIQPSLKQVKINWGVESSTGSKISSSAPTTGGMAMSLLGYISPKAATPPANPEANRQAPFNPPPIFDHQRFLIYNILGKTDKLPEKIQITAESPDGPLTVDLPVDSNSMIHGNLIHTLAARELIRDLENGTSYLHATRNSPSANQVSAEIIRLGKEFNLASKHTSFVAVDKRNPEVVYFVGGCHEPVVFAVQQQQQIRSTMRFGCSPKGAPVMCSFAAPASASLSHAAPVPGSCAPSVSYLRAQSLSYQGAPAQSVSYDCAAECSAPLGGRRRSLERKSSSQRCKKSDAKEKSGYLCEEAESCDMDISSAFSEPPREAPVHAVYADKHQKLNALILLQRINGSFTLTEELCRILGTSMAQVKALQQSPQYAGLSDDVIATILALEFLNKVCYDTKDQWEMIATKSNRFIAKYGEIASRFQTDVHTTLTIC